MLTKHFDPNDPLNRSVTMENNPANHQQKCRTTHEARGKVYHHRTEISESGIHTPRRPRFCYSIVIGGVLCAAAASKHPCVVIVVSRLPNTQELYSFPAAQSAKSDPFIIVAKYDLWARWIFAIAIVFLVRASSPTGFLARRTPLLVKEIA